MNDYIEFDSLYSLSKNFNKIYSSKNYIIFDLGYGLTLLDKSSSYECDEKDLMQYNTMFFQGDDVCIILEKIENYKTSKKSLFDSYLSNYF